MQRDLKFKVWNKKQKQWALKPPFMFRQQKDLSYCCWKFSELNENVPLSKDEYHIIQWTNLLDSTGKEIYEGDILLSEESGECDTVYFEHGCFWVDNQWLYDHNETCRVVGNILENPELLK